MGRRVYLSFQAESCSNTLVPRCTIVQSCYFSHKLKCFCTAVVCRIFPFFFLLLSNTFPLPHPKFNLFRKYIAETFSIIMQNIMIDN